MGETEPVAGRWDQEDGPGPGDPTFAALLRRYRLASGLSQEALAERAGLHAETVGALERGLSHAPQRETVRLLAGALGLGAEERAALEAAIVRRRGPRATAPPWPAQGAASAPF